MAAMESVQRYRQTSCVFLRDGGDAESVAADDQKHYPTTDTQQHRGVGQLPRTGFCSLSTRYSRGRKP